MPLPLPLALADTLARTLLGGLRAVWTRARWQSRGVAIGPRVSLVVQPGNTLAIEPGASLGIGTIVRVTSEMAAGTSSSLRIGRNTAVNEYCNLRASGGRIDIGADCLIAQYVSIIASNHGTAPGTPMIQQPWDRTRCGVTIGRDVWLGAGVTVLPGTRVGDGAIVAAGAVVTRDVPPCEVWGGVPARRIGRRGST